MKIAILGATGSIGLQTIDVIRTCIPEAEITALTGYSNVDALIPLIREFKPKFVCVPKERADDVRVLGCKVVTGEAGLKICAAESGADVVVNALVGRAGLMPTFAAVYSGIDVALANKETLVTAGELLMPIARERNVEIAPIDSEHSAIWQCMQGNEPTAMVRVILTASGGPFRTWSKERIQKKGTAAAALKHPNWTMGPKITVDSATLMNKGLELIEAMWLFNMSPDEIEIVVHPQSIIHSMVEYVDGSIMSQMGMPDMRLPILYALVGPIRLCAKFSETNFLNLPPLTFEAIDYDKFPCLSLAQHAAKTRGTLPTVMNYVNEWAVGEYLQGRLGFYDISNLIEEAFEKYDPQPLTSLNCITQAEAWASEFIKGGAKCQPSSPS